MALLQGAPGTTASAQTAPAPPPASSVPTGQDAAVSNSTETIVVTGSRLKTTNATSEAPVTIVTSAQIEHSSAQTVEDVLQRLPSIGTSGIYNTTNNGGEGASCTDIRNLGINRVLVLVDGRRFVHTGIFGADCVDLNNIPLSLIDSIEILKDGASTVYGADAVSGVINIKLKHNFNGTVIRADGSIATDAGDGRQGELSATTGFNFDKGNVVASVDYLNRGPVLQRDRDYALNIQDTNKPASVGNSFNSGIPPGGRIFPDENNANPNFPGSGDDLALGGGQVRPFTGSDRYPFSSQQFLQGALEKESFTSLANYEFIPEITGYMETFFTHKRTETQLAAQPVTSSLPVGNQFILPDAFVVPEGNPYLTQIYGPNSGPVDLFRRVAEFGDRTNINTTNTFQFDGGFKGTFAENWEYDTFFIYGQSDSNIRSNNEVNFQRLEQEVGFQQEPATANTADATTFGIYNPAVCQAAAGCALINPFGPNSISQAGINYARFNEVATSTFTLRSEGVNITNNNLFQLPFGPVGLALGVENRRESGQYNPDNLVGTGVTLENAQAPTNGSFNVTELYGETRVPILKDVFLAKDLHIDVGGRFYDYNTFGTGETWKISGNWTPVTGIRFRGTDGVAFRQPSIQELFGGQALSFNGATDPCAQVGSYGSKAGTVQANCARQGINTATFQQLGNAQVQTITGGNPSLLPETARTQTLGVVVNPPFIPRSALTFDYFRTKISNAIGTVQTQDILDGCYTSAGLSDPFCKLISPRASQQQLSTVQAIDQNLGVTKEDGLDIGVTYSYPTPGLGTFSFQDDLEIVFQYLSQNVPNGAFINFNQKIIPSADQGGYPRYRDNATFGWSLGNLSANYRVRYASNLEYYPILNPATNGYTKAPGYVYNDIEASYNYANISATIGVDNLFDKDPPFVVDTATNTDPSVYDILGRVVYVKTTFRF